MKRLIVLMAVIFAFAAPEVSAQQGGGDPAAMLQRAKERLKPLLVEKTKITEAQAEKVIEINFTYRQRMRSLRDLPEDDRKKVTAELETAQTKEYKAVPLTDEQIVSVNAFFEEQRKQMQQQRQQNGGNGGN